MIESLLLPARIGGGCEFPDDVCYEILTHLDSLFILKNCVLISNQWKRIIKQTIRLSLDFKREFDGGRAELLKQSQFLERITCVNLNSGNVNVLEAMIMMPNLVRVSFSGINDMALVRRIGDLQQLKELDIVNSRLVDINGLSSMKNLTSLVIRNTNVNGGVININTLQSLTSLNVDSPSLIIEKIDSLINLTSLSIRNNNHMTDIANQLSKLKNLTHLDISENWINDRFESLLELKQLTSLDISGNLISMKYIEHICQLKHLKKLGLRHTRSDTIGAEVAQCLSQLTNLTDLNILDYKIGVKGGVFIGKLTNLTKLDIRSNDIGIEGSLFMEKLYNLTFLDVSYNNIGDAGAQIVGQLKNLTCLHADCNDFGPSGAKVLSKLAKLKILSINHNPIGDIGIEFISRMKKLHSLFVNYCTVGDQGVTSILDMTWLKLLAISNNPSISVELRKLLDNNNYEFLAIEKFR